MDENLEIRQSNGEEWAQGVCFKARRSACREAPEAYPRKTAPPLKRPED